jgi:hypothetical protein
VLVCACGSPDPLPFCEALCKRAHACDSRVDAAVCGDSCNADPPAMRDDALAIMAECVETSSCDAVLSGDYFKPCVAEAQERIQPSADTARFCNALAPASFECGDTYGVFECADDFKLWSTRALDRVADCLSTQHCPAMFQCIEDTLGAP